MIITLIVSYIHYAIIDMCSVWKTKQQNRLWERYRIKHNLSLLETNLPEIKFCFHFFFIFLNLLRTELLQERILRLYATQNVCAPFMLLLIYYIDNLLHRYISIFLFLIEFNSECQGQRLRNGEHRYLEGIQVQETFPINKKKCYNRTFAVSTERFNISCLL